MKLPKIGRSLGNGVIAGGVLVLFGTWIITAVVIRADRRLEIFRAGQNAENLSRMLEKHISGTFAQVEGELFCLRQDLESGIGLENMQQLLSRFVRLRPDLYNLISVIDAEGNIVVTDKADFKPTYSGDRPFFMYHQENTNRTMQLGGPMLGRITGRWFLPVSVRLQDQQGRFTGVLLASINPYYFSILFQNVILDDDALVYLADSEGVVYSGMLGGKKLPLDSAIPHEQITDIFNHPDTVTEVHAGFPDGLERIQSRSFLPDHRMVVSVEVGLREWLAQSRSRTNYLLFSQGLLSVIILWVLIRLRQVISAREAANRELDRFFSSALDLLCIGDTRGRFLRVNKEWENTLGYRTEELENHRFLDLVHPDDVPATRLAMANLERQKTILSFSNRYRCKDGTYRYIEWRSSPHGAIVYCAARDVTERIRTEQALRESEARFRLLFEQAPVPLAQVTPEGGALAINESLVKVLGYKLEDISTMEKWWEQAYPDPVYRAGIRQAWACSVRRARTEGAHVSPNEIRVTGKDGVSHAMLAGIAVMGDTVLVSLMDITERKQAEAELIRHRDHLEELVRERTGQLIIAKDLAEESNRSKSVFLTKMSHELRTPLNAILGYTQILRNKPLGQEVLKGLAIMQQSGEHLLTLINDILSLANIETQHLELHPAPVALAPFMEGLIGIIRPRAEAKGLALRIEVPVALPGAVTADESRLRQVLLNLLSNAVKFTAKGEVIFRVTRLCPTEASADHVLLQFEVEDTGIGIPAGQLPRLFKPFEQIGTGICWAEGTGLGLAISRQLVQLMGTDIFVRSEPGKGSLFMFTVALPFEEGGAVKVDTVMAHAGETVPACLRGMDPVEAIPPDDELNAFWSLARMGDLSAITLRAQALRLAHPEYTLFAERLCAWSAAFEEQKLLEYLGGFIRKDTL